MKELISQQRDLNKTSRRRQCGKTRKRGSRRRGRVPKGNGPEKVREKRRKKQNIFFLLSGSLSLCLSLSLSLSLSRGLFLSFSFLHDKPAAPQRKREKERPQKGKEKTQRKHRTGVFFVKEKREKVKKSLLSSFYATSADAVALSYFQVGGSFLARL